MRGPTTLRYELLTNDPKRPVLTLNLFATVKPPPPFVERLAGIQISQGETIGGFNAWPTWRPALTLERGEKLEITIRLKATNATAGVLSLADGAPSFCKLRADEKPGVYWLDITAGPLEASLNRNIPLIARAADGSSVQLKAALLIEVPDENLIATPRDLDLGELTLSSVNAGLSRSGKLGVRKLVGTFRITSITSTLSFLTFEQQTIVDNRNYLIRVRLDAEKAPKPGLHTGTISIRTDDGQKLDVPIKVSLANK